MTPHLNPTPQTPQVNNPTFVVVTLDDFNQMVNEAAKNLSMLSAKENVSESSSSNSDEEKYLTREEVSKMLKVDYTTLWRWNKSNKLCCHKIGERKVVYLLSDVEACLKKKRP